MEKIKKWKARPFSWSQISQFRDYDKEKWYEKYVLGKETPTNKEMAFGSAVGKRIETDPVYIPEVKREATMEYELKVKMGDIELVGYADSYGEETKVLIEYKTGKGAWTQKRVDDHDQITMYLLMLYLKYKTKPEDVKCHLYWLPTCERGDFSLAFCKPFKIHHFETKRTNKQVKLFGASIIKLRKEMEEFINRHQ